MSKFQAWFTDDNKSYSTNGKQFDNVGDATLYAMDLMYRWTSALNWAILPVDNKFVGHLNPEIVFSNHVSLQEI